MPCVLFLNMIGSIYLCCKSFQLVIAVKIHKRMGDMMQCCLMGRHQCFGLTLVTFFFWVEYDGPRYLRNCISYLQNYVASYTRRLCYKLITAAYNNAAICVTVYIYAQYIKIGK